MPTGTGLSRLPQRPARAIKLNFRVGTARPVKVSTIRELLGPALWAAGPCCQSDAATAAAAGPRVPDRVWDLKHEKKVLITVAGPAGRAHGPAARRSDAATAAAAG